MTQVLAIPGTAANPGLRYATALTTGLFSPAIDTVSFSSAGVDALDISLATTTVKAPVTHMNQQEGQFGTATNPSITFTSDTQTGIYRSGTHILSFSCATVDVLDVGAAGITFNMKTTFFGDNRISAAHPNMNTNFVLNTSTIARTGNEHDVFIGVGAGNNMITNLAENDVFIGWHAGLTQTNTTSSVIIGGQAREATTVGGGNSVHIGAMCGQNSSGGNQTMIGYKAGLSMTANCTVVGFQAATGATSSSNSTIIGNNTFPNLTTGTNNTSVGDGSGTGITTGSSNSFFGRLSAASTGTLSFGTAIGSQATVSASNTVQLGRKGIDAVSCGSSLSVHGSQVTDSNGHLVRTEASGTVTVGAGVGAGTGATAVLATNPTDSTGFITLTTGTSPLANNVLINLTFAQMYTAPPVMIITPANAAAAALTGTHVPFVDQNFTTGSRLFAQNALAASTVYSWWYHVMH